MMCWCSDSDNGGGDGGGGGVAWTITPLRERTNE